MEEKKKTILNYLKKENRKEGKFEHRVMNLVLQKLNSDLYAFDNKAVYNADKTLLIYQVSDVERVTIATTVKSIGRMAFNEHRKLSRLNLAAVEEIGQEAFLGCEALQTLHIPSSGKVIKKKAFGNCLQLKKLVFEGVPPKINASAFSGCEELKLIEVPQGATDVVSHALGITDGSEIMITEIGEKTEIKHD